MDDNRAEPTTNRRIALLIDADNVSHSKIAAILGELSRHGTANIRRAYGDWASPGLQGWRDKLHGFAIRPIQQFSYSTGKNATDIALVIDAMELLYTQRPDAFCIASSDADFTPLVMHLKAAGHEVYGFGERKTPEPFVNACTTFLFLDSLASPEPAPPVPPVPPPAADPTKPAKPATLATLANPAKPVSPPAKPANVVAAPAKPKLAQDTKLVAILRGAVEAAQRDDGWALLSVAGSHAKRQAPIDPRNYGVKNFPALFEATGLFVIVKGADCQGMIADKRNKDRAAKPD
ncbi:NYN domain-containing protein [Sandarakinorhabdus sp. DWP1-3-1]|uniref:NYN domain-containing protein n=1 Tax=Sandarakinorhabdus sp. DWP1-3-1 TaxID=2804627 RepID=UPI003CF83463